MEGEERRPKHRCETCNGSGRVSGIRKVTGLGGGMGSAFGPCPDCDGVGWVAIDNDDAGRPLRLDDASRSADPDRPAFLARPEGAPIYYGFPILDDVEVDGFRLGMITDWESDPSTDGDAFVVAPDGSRCGLIWAVDAGPQFAASIEPEPRRWGVWNVNMPHPMDSRENARRNLAHLLPQLRAEWSKWVAGARVPE